MKYISVQLKKNKVEAGTNQTQAEMRPKPADHKRLIFVSDFVGAISDHVSHPQFLLFISNKPTVASAGSVKDITSCTSGMFPTETSVTPGL